MTLFCFRHVDRFQIDKISESEKTSSKIYTNKCLTNLEKEIFQSLPLNFHHNDF